MSNVLHDKKQQQVVALGDSPGRIEQATRVRRETASGYLKAAQIPSASAAGDRGYGHHNGHHAGGVHRLGTPRDRPPSWRRPPSSLWLRNETGPECKRERALSRADAEALGLHTPAAGAATQLFN